jgi:hypothetical protein
VALCAGYLLTGSASFAASDVSPETPAIPSVVLDQETEALLHALDQQISTEHIVSPPNDNAMETWQRVFQRKLATRGSPGFLRALADFETRARTRAANEKAAGNTLVAVALTVFADEATRLAGNISPSDTHGTAATSDALSESGSAIASAAGAATSDGPAEPAGTAAPASGVATRDGSAGIAAPASGVATRDGSAGIAAPASGATTRDVRIDQATGQPQSPRPAPAVSNPRGADAALAQIQTPPRDSDTPGTSPVVGGADTTAARPTSAVGDLAPTTPVPAVPPEPHPPTARESAMAAFYAARGDEMLSLKDISAARKFYEYAANAGSARAATALARTYDPAFVAQLGVVGLKPDPALAATWYRKAAELGGPRSGLQLLTQSAATAK